MAAVRRRATRSAAVGRRGIPLLPPPPPARRHCRQLGLRRQGRPHQLGFRHPGGPHPASADIPVARITPSPAVTRPTTATERTPPPRPLPPRTASVAVESLLAVLQALPSLLTHPPESPYFGVYELKEAPQLPPPMSPENSGPCPDHEPEIPPWGTAVGGNLTTACCAACCDEKLSLTSKKRYFSASRACENKTVLFRTKPNLFEKKLSITSKKRTPGHISLTNCFPPHHFFFNLFTFKIFLCTKDIFFYTNFFLKHMKDFFK